MPQQHSAGILLYRRRGGGIEVLLGHPGGPYWARKDAGAWMVPKGAIEAGEKPIEAAVREFAEEVGPLPPGTPIPLRSVRQNGGKLVDVFALEGDFDPDSLVSAKFEMEWPPRSGRLRSYPKLDRVKWMALADARRCILQSQAPLIEALKELLAAPGESVEQEPGK